MGPCGSKGVVMHYLEESESKDNSDAAEKQHLVLDGTANLDYQDEEQIPRVKGLIELFNIYFGGKKKNDP